jgi:mannose-6-phosphate isomerase-like protein (cupin superfamily)
MRLTSGNALASPRQHPEKRFLELFRHGSLVLEVVRPDRVDLQTPHSRDEVSTIISGSGQFVNEGVRQEFGPGEFLFVAAGAAHHFEGLTDDFATGVIYYGPDGGEAKPTQP